VTTLWSMSWLGVLPMLLVRNSISLRYAFSCLPLLIRIEGPLVPLKVYFLFFLRAADNIVLYMLLTTKLYSRRTWSWWFGFEKMRGRFETMVQTRRRILRKLIIIVVQKKKKAHRLTFCAGKYSCTFNYRKIGESRIIYHFI
jgi:hypothetical protein